MKALLLTIAGGLQRKGIVRVYWDYQANTDIYANCEVFYGYERMTSTFEKVSRLPENCEIDEITYYEDVCEITLKGN